MRWNGNRPPVTRLARHHWPWPAGAVLALTVFGYGALGVGSVLLPLALASLTVALVCFAHRWVEAWWLFLTAYVAFVAYGLFVVDYGPSIMYYLVAVGIGAMGLAIWRYDAARR